MKLLDYSFDPQLCSIFVFCCIVLYSIVLYCYSLPRAPVLTWTGSYPAYLNLYFYGQLLWFLAPPFLLDTGCWIFFNIHNPKNLTEARPSLCLNLNPGSRTYHLTRKIFLLNLHGMFINHYYLFAFSCWLFFFLIGRKIYKFSFFPLHTCILFSFFILFKS